MVRTYWNSAALQEEDTAPWQCQCFLASMLHPPMNENHILKLAEKIYIIDIFYAKNTTYRFALYPFSS